MNLEEIKKLSDGELGRQLAEAVGSYYQDGFSYVEGGRYPHPDRCFNTLCGSLDAIAEVEKIVIEKVGDDYAEFLRRAIYGRYIGHNGEICTATATATARQRAEACLLALLTPSPVTEEK
jgi:hypothetical protein